MTKLKVLLIDDGKWIVAQCLQYDIAAQGKSKLAAIKNLREMFDLEVIVCRLLGKTFSESIPPAPKWYWDEYRTLSHA